MFVRLEKLHAEIVEIDSHSEIIRAEIRKSMQHLQEVLTRLEAS